MLNPQHYKGVHWGPIQTTRAGEEIPEASRTPRG